MRTCACLQYCATSISGCRITSYNVCYTKLLRVQNSVGWKFERIEKRALDMTQPELMFLNPLGEVFQVYLESYNFV